MRLRAWVGLFCILLPPLVLLAWLEPASAQQTQIPQEEYDALVALYNATNGANWTNDWTLPTAEPCNLYGVTCDSEHVTGLNLGSNHLSGGIPPELGNLASLHSLVLDDNELSGGIPSELGKLGSLTYLDLSSNQLSGGILPELGKLGSLTDLNLGSNQLSGGIPVELMNLSNLRYLSLCDNQLGGTIPPELGNLSNLTRLYLCSNQLIGSVPSGLVNLINLRYLDLGSNQLGGAIPPELANLSYLYQLDLGSNQLSGAIPPELGNLTYLAFLDLSSNQLSGSVPAQFGGLENLRDLSLEANGLRGPIPSELGKLSHLGRLALGSNQFSGTIPSSLADLADLEILHLGSNRLSGPILPELGKLTNLRQVNLSQNQLSGTIPPALGDLSNLQYLDLFLNQLSGAIPAELGNLMALTHLDIGYNMLWVDGSSPSGWLAAKDPDWAETQTVPPAQVQVELTARGAEVSWPIIAYTGDGGHYEVGVGTIPGGPYPIVARTVNKFVCRVTLTGLAPNTSYYLAVRTFTPAHDFQQNDLLSPYGTEVTFTTGLARLSLPLLLRQPAPTPVPWCDPYEPNDDRHANPWGPLAPGTAYSAKLCQGDPEDNYSFDLPSTSRATVQLSLPASLVGRTGIAIYAATDLSQPMAFQGPLREVSSRLELGPLQPGRYIVRIYAEDAWDDEHPYELQVTLPHAITEIHFDPPSPATVGYLEPVDITFRYSTEYSGRFRVWAIGYAGGTAQPYKGSEVFSGPSTGTVTRQITVFAGDGEVTIDTVRFSIQSADESQTLLEFDVPVRFTFVP